MLRTEFGVNGRRPLHGAIFVVRLPVAFEQIDDRPKRAAKPVSRLAFAQRHDRGVSLPGTGVAGQCENRPAGNAMRRDRVDGRALLRVERRIRSATVGERDSEQRVERRGILFHRNGTRRTRDRLEARRAVAIRAGGDANEPAVGAFATMPAIIFAFVEDRPALRTTAVRPVIRRSGSGRYPSQDRL